LHPRRQALAQLIPNAKLRAQANCVPQALPRFNRADARRGEVDQ